MWDAPRLLKLDDFVDAPALWASGRAQVVGCLRDSVTVRDDPAGPRLAWQPAAGAFDPETNWLLDADRAWFAHRADDACDCGTIDECWSLRRAWPLLSDVEAQAAVAGVALAAWHDDFRFCPACGGPLHGVAGGWAADCAGCGAQHFPRIDPAIIVALIDDADRLLLGGQPSWGKRRSVFAGFVTAGESLEQAVHREVGEEVGLTIDHLRFFGSQPWPLPRSLMVAFTAHVANPGDVHVDGREIIQADWFTRDEARAAWASGAIDRPAPMSIASRMIDAWVAG